ncbi:MULTISPECIES: cupin domain-containing protein [Tepidibacter]|jgi:quercetin dioxygenase-like cupin family protein|uniref:Mannose-6-phosphate isomerase, cupin superfamily n=2 Tax=Tepidibacter TaxID=214904 RepID=A0A1M5SJK6_9FIRM|nr:MULTISPECIES: cupin domain-containing protein [Tepidibacter]SHH38671.1 Mannose-6-phosphate isomerase, cupin superfamily [Tepidibacter thalassicus DSM 15285]SHK18876.1 Mannose-6-phosphate isomerase, cupin superfamily [Tepidibacter formicigenes DSM 15518]
MLEKIYKYSTGNEKAIEKIINDENIHLNHMIFNKGEGLPEHFANSNVYMIVIRGTLSIQLGDQEVHEYVKGDILNIPYNTKMNVGNKHDETLEIFVIKAPNPKDYVQK